MAKVWRADVKNSHNAQYIELVKSTAQQLEEVMQLDKDPELDCIDCVINDTEPNSDQIGSIR